MAVIDRLGRVASNGVRWSGALATELALLPATIRHLREAVVAITLLPPEIERLNVALEDASGTLEAHVPDLSRVVGRELSERVDHLDEVVSELSTTLTGVLGAIPGVRRSVRTG